MDRRAGIRERGEERMDRRTGIREIGDTSYLESFSVFLFVFTMV